MSELSAELHRELGLLVDRGGHIEWVIVGDAGRIYLPDIGRTRADPTRLRGLRLIHTQFNGQPIAHDDVTDLTLLRLDLVATISVAGDGLPGDVHTAHILPDDPAGKGWAVLPSAHPSQLDVDVVALVSGIEEELARLERARAVAGKGERTILVSVYTGSHEEAEASMRELEELARTSRLVVLDRICQRRRETDPRHLLGKGKLEELLIRSMQLGADVLVFDQNLTPVQAKLLSASTDLKIIDRTQLILDIFAQRAKSRDGKIQVELAQLRYLLPRLSEKNRGFSRLTGGIGLRGPGETKLEVDRRRINDRIARLQREIQALGRQRGQRRARRRAARLPVISLIGYTNAGKSTLLNALTYSEALAEDRLFATLDPLSRRLRFPEEREAIISDTVGFIRDLPPDLVAAFRATLEELEEADLLVHVVDASNPAFEAQMEAVAGILEELELTQIPQLLAFNKVDLVPAVEVRQLCARYRALPISALTRQGLVALVEAIQQRLFGPPQTRSAAG